MRVACVPVVAPEIVRSLDERPAVQLAPRDGAFVGRERELAALVAAIDSGVRRVWISGASGLGKTELLAQLAIRCRARGAPYYWLGPHEAATPSALRAISDELGRAAGHGDRRVLLIDDFAPLRAVESWFVERFLPAIPAQITVVVADRSALPAWRGVDPHIALAPLGDVDALRYLVLRGVVDRVPSEVVALAEGIPAMLAAAADAAAGALPSGAVAECGAAFYARHDSDAHRLAIAILAAARTTPYELLELAFDDAGAARDAFAWLSRLSVVDHTPDGLRPHTLLRRACERALARHAGALWARAREVVRWFADHRIAFAVPPTAVPPHAVSPPGPPWPVAVPPPVIAPFTSAVPLATSRLPLPAARAAATPRRATPPAADAHVAADAADADEPSSALERRIAQLAKSAALSPREHEVLQLLLLGRNYAEIGTALRITPRTARFHQHNILEKIGAESRLDIVRLLL